MEECLVAHSVQFSSNCCVPIFSLDFKTGSQGASTSLGVTYDVGNSY